MTSVTACEDCGGPTDGGGLCGPCWGAAQGRSAIAGTVGGQLAELVDANTIHIPRRPAKRAGESEIVRRIREAVGALEGVTIWRNNTGMLEDRHGTKVRFGLCEGSADLVGIVQMRRPVYVNGAVAGYAVDGFSGVGRFFALEVKQPGKKPTAAQHAFLDLVRSLGGYGAWCDSVSDALAHVEKARAL